MDIDARIGTVTFQYPADAFHRVTIESQVVDIDSVDADIFCQPVQSFHIEVVPARNAGVHDCRILVSIYKPGSDVVAVQMFL